VFEYGENKTTIESMDALPREFAIPEKVHSTSLERAFTILEYLDGSRRGQNISELSRRLGIPKSTAHVIVATLRRLGYLTFSEQKHGYSLGLKVYGLGRGLIRSFGLPERALNPMKSLAETTKCTCQLAILVDEQAMYIQKVESPGGTEFDSYIGKRTNLHCTGVGKVLLAYAADPEGLLNRRSFARYTQKTITSPAALRKELTKVRQKGFALDDEEEELEVRCLAAPVFGQSGECLAALAIAGTTNELRDAKLDEFAGCLLRATRIISQPAKSTSSSDR
jgi:DNA-binding IclR family transcriptional regulator